MTDTTLHPRIAEVTAALSAAQDEMEMLMRSITPEQAAARTGDGWTVAQIIEHLAVVEDGSGRLVANLIKEAAGTTEQEASPVAPSLDAYRVWDPSGRKIEAPDMVAPKEGLSIDESMGRLRRARARLIAAFEAGSGLAIGKSKFPHPALGPLNAYQWGHATAQHQRRHITQIRTILSAQS